ncbi:Dolichol kinase EVAN [Diplonema papillatum]|nr:Dolichol kinase EVAN [Diplonema papillatum]|eukprot:gene10306-15853_t
MTTVQRLARAGAGDCIISTLLYILVICFREGNVPRKSVALLYFVSLAAQLIERRKLGARDASSGLMLGSCLLPLLYVVMQEDDRPIGYGYIICWVCSVCCCVCHVAWHHRTLRYIFVTGLLVLLWMLRAPHPGQLAIPFALVGASAYVAVIVGVKRSFSEGEAVICGQLWALLTFTVVGVPLGFHQLTKLRISMAFGSFGAVLIAVTVLVMSRVLKVRKDAVYLAVVGVLFWVDLAAVSWAFNENSVVWLVGYLLEKKGIALMFSVYYAAVIVVGVIFAPVNFDKKHRTIIRKYFHVLALIMFVPTILYHVRFMALAMAVAFSVFIVIEALRMSGVEPIASATSGVMKPYLEEKDKGDAVLTHLHLLLGCAMPVWFVFTAHHGGLFSARSLLSAVSGVAVTGLGDMCASVSGKLFGRHRWFGSHKTVEGSATMLLSIVIFHYWVLWVYGFDDLSYGSLLRLLLADVFVVVLEAVTDQIDNLVLPLCHLITLQMI